MQNLLNFAIIIYGLSTLFFIVLSRTVSDDVTLVAFFSSFLHLMLLPALVLLPICLLWRNWKLIVLLLPIVMTFIIFYGAFFKPQRINASHNGPAFTVLTFNIHKRNDNYDAVIEVIRASSADLVAVQELSIYAAESLRASLEAVYPYMALHPQRNAGFGQGIFSKYPILEDEYFVVERAHQRVLVQIGDSLIVVYNSHILQPLGYYIRFEARKHEIQQLLERAEAEPYPVILVGDFNMTDQADDYERITSTYHDAYREAGYGLGFTYPASGQRFPVPVVRPDFIFYDSHLYAIEARRLPAGGSDHHPVFARFVR